MARRRFLPTARSSLQLEHLESRHLLAASVMISEFMAKNDGFLQDGEHKSPDWIEVFNAGDETVDLGGYRLSDAPDDPSRWTFPSKVLEPGQYLVVFASGNDFIDAAGSLHTNFKLGADGEYLALVSPEGQVLSQFGSAEASFPVQRSNTSYGLAQSVTLLAPNSEAFYKVPVDAADDTLWTRLEFDAAANGFDIGKAALGTENRAFFRENLANEITTSLPEDSLSVYARIHFNIDDPDTISQLLLDMKYDNGFVAYLNGQLVAADNAPDAPTWSSTAVEERPSDGEAVNFTVFDVSAHRDALVAGDNVLALHGLNHAEDEGDMLLAARLRAVVPSLTNLGHMPRPTPGAVNGEAFTGFVLDPQLSVTRGFYDTAQMVNISTATEGADICYTTDGSPPSCDNPAAQPYSEPLAVDSLTTLRVAAFKDGFVPSRVDTHTYVFIDDVIRHPRLHGTITQHPDWGPQLRDSLRSVPTISIVLGQEVNEETILQEVPISFEYLVPDGSDFQINAGLEHFGGGALTAPKKSIRISFKSIYGQPSLEYDLFGESAVTEFDQLLLRAGSQDNWTWLDSVYFRNRWAFDRQLEMGQLAPHGQFVQLYINGQYWGLQHLMERPNAAFLASYLGGDKEDFESLNRGSAIDSDGSRWEELKTKAAEGDYEVLKRLLDESNYVDYMLLMIYAGNDWDWGDCCNWMATTDAPGGEGFKFFAWDSDMILRRSVNADLTGNGGPGNFWAHALQHDDFKLLVADRIQQYFFDDGILTPRRVLAQIDDLEDELRLPLIAETARWSGEHFTLDRWQQNVEDVRRYVTRRTDVVIQQLRDAGVFPELTAPNIRVDGQLRHGGPIPAQHQIELETPTHGTVYYTLNGADPRLDGGAISPDAIAYDGSLVLQPEQVVKARVLHNDQWSPLRNAQFTVSDLWITELNYHPHDALVQLGETDVDNAFEFVELMNIGASPLELDGVRLSQAIRFTFSPQTLDPGERIVVVQDIDAFRARYGNDPRIARGNDGQDGAEGEYGGRLANEGESIQLEDKLGRTIEQFTFAANNRWPVMARGRGGSLQITDVLRPADDASSWRHSYQFGGSPGAADTAPHDVLINEVLPPANAEIGVRIELYNSTDRQLDIGGWFISDTIDDLFRLRIDPGTTIAPDGFHVIETPTLGSHFDASGGQLWLIAADANGKPARFMDQVAFGSTASGVSVGRWPTPQDPLIAMSGLTFGGPNPRPWVGDVIITEVHPNPVDADGDAKAVDADDSEFVELYNRSDAPVDLSGWWLDGSAQYTFREGTVLQPGESLVVAAASVRDRTVIRRFFGIRSNTQVLGQLRGPLPDTMGTVKLVQPLGPPSADPSSGPQLVHDEINYKSAPPWPSPGQGASYVRTRPDTYGPLPSHWNAAAPTPGHVSFDRLIGDVNDDGIFSMEDLIIVFNAGKYDDDIPNNATFDEGDWNQDGDFDEHDLLAALAEGHFMPDADPAAG